MVVSASNSYEKVETFKYLGSLLTIQNSIQEGIKCRLKAGNSCYYSVQTLLSSRLLSKIESIYLYLTLFYLKVENKGKLILTEIFPSVQKHDI